jgi:hypothetical protein
MGFNSVFKGLKVTFFNHGATAPVGQGILIIQDS